MQTRELLVAAFLCLATQISLSAADPLVVPLSLSVSNNIKSLSWTRPLIPALESQALFSGESIDSLGPELSGFLTVSPYGYNWMTSNGYPQQFFNLQLFQMSSNALLAANALNRLAYGPTPDELERVTAIGAQAYIDEQLDIGDIVDTTDAYIVETTNGAAVPLPSTWTSITVTGSFTSATLYMYLTTVGEVLVDDIQMKYSYTTTAVTNNGGVITTNVYSTLTSNVLVNGDFESALNTGWTVSNNLTNSYIDTTVVCSDTGSLRMISTAPGTTQNSSIWQTGTSSPPTTASGTNVDGSSYTNTVNNNNTRVYLSFSYLPNAYSGQLVLRLSSSGTRINGVNAAPAPTWVYAAATGLATNTPTLYIYPDGACQFYVDDIKLVRGSLAEAGTNLLQNGDFETGLLTPWVKTADFNNSVISSNYSHRGSYSLKVVATAPGTGNNDSIYQTNIFGVTNRGTYTVSFWYLPSTPGRTITVRLSGASETAPEILKIQPDLTVGSIRRRMETIAQPRANGPQITVESIGGVNLADLRAWYIQNCVSSKRQLLEVLTQFLENHFVTQHSKSFDYLDGVYDGNIVDVLATDWEWREISKWRNALLNPNCTFHDLLKIHAESPAEIVYLDTVNSRGDGSNTANENYSREIFELFCMGVDNGYEQNDIVAQSRAWTGWSVDIVDPQNINNPLAPVSTTYGFYPGNGYNARSNIVGVWTFNYKTSFHGTNRAPLFSIWHSNSTPANLIALGPKTVPGRFGSPWAGQSYQLTLPRYTNTDTNGIREGYMVIGHLATNVVMTAEYISIKLCRLFVHEGFPNPTTRTELPEYDYYNYTNPNITEEARLVHACIQAWYLPGPDGRRGNIRNVLSTIFGSELFRSHGGSLQKVKTPLELAVSTVRALRSQNPDGTYTASTDGYSISGRDRTASSAPLTRMGTMMLFDRDAPDGYPEDAAPWISAGTLAERLRFIQTTLMSTSDTSKNDLISGGNFNLTDPVTLLKRKVDPSSAAAVADYFISILFPGEGKLNLDLYRQSAITFLNTDNNGVSSPFSGLNNASTGYGDRVRGLVAALMSFPRFQEQ